MLYLFCLCEFDLSALFAFCDVAAVVFVFVFWFACSVHAALAVVVFDFLCVIVLSVLSLLLLL